MKQSVKKRRQDAASATTDKRTPPPQTTIRTVPLDSFTVSPLNARQEMDDDAIRALMASIARSGLLHPVTCRPLPDDPDRYEVLAGVRRLEACRRLGMKMVPAVCYEDLTAAAAAGIVAAENLERQDLSPLEQADEIERMLNAGLTIEDVAQAIGKSIYFVAGRRQLSNLSDQVRTKIVSGELAIDGRAREAVPFLVEIAKLPPHLQLEAAELTYVVDNVQQFRKALENMLAPTNLNAARWKLSDPDIVPEAGACTACTKRTGAQGLLWPEMAQANKDICLDQECFGRKVAAIVARHADELKRQTGKEPVVIVDVTTDRKTLSQAIGNRPIVNNYDVRNVAPSVPGAMPAISAMGEKCWVAPLRANRQDPRRTAPTHSAGGHEKSIATRRTELHRRRLAKAVELFRAALDDEVFSENDVLGDLNLLRLVVAFGTDQRADYPWGSNQDGRDVDRWKVFDAIKTYEDAWNRVWENTRAVFTARLRIVGPVTTAESAELAWRECERLAGLLGLRAQHFLDEATLALPEPKSWTNGENAGGAVKTRKDRT